MLVPARLTRRRARPAALAAGVAAALAAMAFSFAPPAPAQYQVTDDLVQWDWIPALEAEAYQITDVAVRDDGWLIVATVERYDGYLHVVPPWGGTLGPSNRLGTTPYGFRQIEVNGSSIYGLHPDIERDQGQTGVLRELDAETGEERREIGEFWYQDLALDPATGDLVLQDLGKGDRAFAHPVVRVDPASGRKSVVIPDGDPRADVPLELAFNHDGSRLYAAHATGSQIDVHLRNGTPLYSIQVGRPVDALAVGAPGTCLAGALIYTRSDGTAWVVRDPSTPLAAGEVLAGGGRAPAASFVSLDRNGHVLTPRLAEVTLLACPPFDPPQPPKGVPAPPPPVEAAAAAPASAPPPPPPTNPPAPPQAAPPAPQPPAPAPPPAPPTPSFAGPAQPASAAHPGIADSPEEQPVLSLSASTHQRTTDPSVLAFLLGAAAVAGMAAAAHVLTQTTDNHARGVQARAPTRRS